MPPLPIIDAKTFIRFLHHLGFEKIRQKGSHLRYAHPDGRKLSVPVHGKENLKRGLLHGMLHEIGVEVEALLEFLGR